MRDHIPAGVAAFVCAVGCMYSPIAVAAVSRLPLDQKNICVDWTATKVVRGHHVSLGGSWDESGRSSGEIILATVGGVRQISASIDLASVWCESDVLANVLRKPIHGFFALDEHPEATFSSRAVKEGAPDDASMPDATHVVEGDFQLNGVTKPITFPARIRLGAGKLELVAKFNLNRQDYQCRLKDPPAGILVKDGEIFDDVAIHLKIKTRIPPEYKYISASTLPRRFSQTVEVFQVKFDMVLVSGDDVADIEPLYVCENEVTWGEFLPWASAKDMVEYSDAARLRAKKLRPSLPHTDVTRAYGVNGFPAQGMTRLSAITYCRWLSEQTGRKYRLPTEKEWVHIYRLGRGGKGPLLTAEEAMEIAVYRDTSYLDNERGHQTLAVGSQKVDALGLHDMVGNVAEWVLDTGGEEIARGGHFLVGLPDLGGREIIWPDQEWPGVPNEPRSQWWRFMPPPVGFRVVCDP